MSVERSPLVLHARKFVLADWRGDASFKETNRPSRALVVDDDGLFAPEQLAAQRWMHYVGVVSLWSDDVGVPISIRLDDDVRAELEAQARARGVGLATLLRDVATKAARDARRARIWQASEAIGHQVATSAEAQAFYDEIGTPTTNAG